MEDYQTTDIKEEVVDCGFVEVSQDEHQLCTACLCATRTTRTLDDDALQQYYMHILTEMQPEGGVVLQSPRVCWECVSHLKRAVLFREQVQDSYRLLQPMLSMCDKEDLEEFLQTSVCRPGRLKTCFTHSIDISPKGETVGIIGSLDNNIVVCVPEDKPPLMSNYQAHDINKETSEETTERRPSQSEPSPDEKVSVLEPIVKLEVQEHVSMMQTSIMETGRGDVDCSDRPARKTPKRPTKRKQTKSKLRRQCEYCSKEFSTTRQLNTHIRSHTGERPYMCTTCGKTYTQIGHLRDHAAVHTGNKPHPCALCEKAFYRKTQLERHEQVHTGDKPHKCELCPKRFAQKNNLVRHVKAHKDERAHECAVCQKRFITRSKLALHSNRHKKKSGQ